MSLPPYHNCGIFRRTLGYITNATYRAPPDLTAKDVIDFYIERVGADWDVRKQTLESIPVVTVGETPRPTPGSLGQFPAAHFERGEATLSIQAIGMTFSSGPAGEAGGDFSVIIDSKGKVERPYCD